MEIVSVKERKSLYDVRRRHGDRPGRKRREGKAGRHEDVLPSCTFPLLRPPWPQEQGRCLTTVCLRLPDLEYNGQLHGRVARDLRQFVRRHPLHYRVWGQLGMLYESIMGHFSYDDRYNAFRQVAGQRALSSTCKVPSASCGNMLTDGGFPDRILHQNFPAIPARKVFWNM